MALQPTGNAWGPSGILGEGPQSEGARQQAQREGDTGGYLPTLTFPLRDLHGYYYHLRDLHGYGLGL